MNFIKKLITNLGFYNVSRKELTIIALGMIYVLCKIVCNPLFFRHIEINMPFINYAYETSSSAITYPMIYIINDIIVMLVNRRFAIKLIIIGILCDGMFSFFTSAIANLDNMAFAPVIIFGKDMWLLFVHGLIGTVIASICETILFAYFFRKLNSFLFSTFISMTIILLIHNVLTDYYIMQQEKDRFTLIIHNSISELIIMTVYILIIVIFIRLIKIRYLFTPIRFKQGGNLIN